VHTQVGESNTPIEPIKIGPFVAHGMFLRRKKEVSAEFSSYLASNVLTSRDIWRNILTGESKLLFEKIVKEKAFIRLSRISGLWA